MNIYKSDFIDQLVKEKHYTKVSATALVNDFWAMIEENMSRGNTVNFIGYGCFDMLERKERSCPSPKDGSPCVIPAHWVPRFYPGKNLRLAVKKWESCGNKGAN